MKDRSHPGRRRVLAGLAALGVLPTPPSQAQASALPTCSVKERSLNDRVKISGTLSEPSDISGSADYDFHLSATVRVRPLSKILNGVEGFRPLTHETFENSVVLTRRASSNILTGKYSPSYQWQEWGFFMPSLKFVDGVRIPRLFVRISLDDKSYNKDLWFVRNSYRIAVRGGRPAETIPFEGFLKDGELKQNDYEVPDGFQFSSWYGTVREGKLTLEFSVNKGDFSDPVMTLVYDKADIYDGISAVGNDLQAQVDGFNAKTCKLYKPGCFMTTAACEVVGLEDDCWELEAMRDFRDNWLAQQPGGVAIIGEYYASAPGIVSQVSKSPRAGRTWLALYWRFIVPTAILSRAGFKRAAFGRYMAMMRCAKASNFQVPGTRIKTGLG